jgi:hypothetical protein
MYSLLLLLMLLYALLFTLAVVCAGVNAAER